MTALAEYLGELRTQAERHLSEAARPEPGLPAALREAMLYSLLAPGKRLRMALAVLANEACGGGDPWPAACAVEMIHAYSLIHDDLPAMDDDDLRRGQPTCHKKFGEALAILAGDALQTLAFQTLAEGYPATIAAACCRELARASGAAGMVGGQVDDLAWEQSTSDTASRTVEGLEFLHARKTGALIRAALRMGVLASRLQSTLQIAMLERFETYGRCLGLAFQIVDDLLDVEGAEAQTGKRVGKDAGRGKLTYPGLLGIDESRRRAARLGREAIDALAPLGPSAEKLSALVDHVLERDH